MCKKNKDKKGNNNNWGTEKVYEVVDALNCHVKVVVKLCARNSFVEE